MAEARAHFARGNQSAALQLACAILKRDPRNVDAYILLGEIALTKTGGGPVAEKLSRQALGLKPDDIGAQRLLGLALAAQDRSSEASALLAKVLKSRANDLSALLALARIRETAKQFSAAEALLRSATVLHPQAVVAANSLGDFLKRRGQLAEALAWHCRAVGAGAAPVLVPGAKRRIAFLVQYPQGWTSLKSVWESFVADPSCEVTVITCPFNHPNPGSDAINGFLQDRGVPFVHWTNFKWEPAFADVLFVQLPYDSTRPPELRVAELLKLVPRLAYVPYALEIGGGAENKSLLANQPLHQVAWAIFARSLRHKTTFAHSCTTGDAHVAVTGHPKMDALRQLSEVRDDDLLHFANGRRLVVWNPHFDTRPDGSEWGGGYSTFMRWQRHLVGEFARRENFALVIRPHPLFFEMLERRRIMSGADIAGFLAQCAEVKNIQIDRRPSYLPVFAASAAMLSDASSFLLEYAATGKPLLYLHNPRGPGLNADGDFVRDHCATAQTEEEIARFLDAVAAGQDVSRDARLAAFRQECMHLPPEGAGETIRQTVLARLEAETALRVPRIAAG